MTIDLLNAIHCGHGKFPPCPPPTPVPIITFSPSAPNLDVNAPIGTLIAFISVTMSDGSAFTGTLGFAAPYYNDGGICAIQGTSLILGAELPSGSSTQYCSITANP
jgi:hypothetical protein